MVSEAIISREKESLTQHVASGVTYLMTVFVNLYFVEASDGSWSLIDTGLPLQAARVRRAAEERFGTNARPTSIILTHGHFDHAGNALDLAREWGVPVYAHELEIPYLTGKSDYPPQDPTVGGALAQMSRLFPHSGYDFGSVVQSLPQDKSVPGLPDWRVIHTPGHTAGHISLFRERDRTLITGDALATVNQESVITLITLERELRQPPAPLTTDWVAARDSLRRLAELQPTVIAAGHGLPIKEGDVAGQMRQFAQTFSSPAHGRYVREPARADERGVTYVPPPVPDPTGRFIKGAALAVAAGAVVAVLWRRRATGVQGRRAQSAPLSLPSDKAIGALEQVVAFTDSMPTGVTVEEGGRIFVNFPRWGDPVPFTVAEIKNGQPVAYPDAEINRLDIPRAKETFVSVQSVIVDPRNRLWVLDTGSIKFEPVVPNGPKLVGIDLQTNRIFKTIHFPADVVLPTTYLNDVRFDLRRGRDGVAYITDSSDKGANGIIVVDLASGKSRRLLNDHPTTKAETNFLPFVEGQALMQRQPGEPPRHIKLGADGIAISADGTRLFYCPLASRRLYSVATDALLNEKMTDIQVAATVKDEGMKPASDGLESDAQGRIYCTDYETNGIVRRKPDGMFEIVVHDQRALWPDTISIASDGYLYFTANQLHRQADYHDGQDLRVKPYSLFRVKIDGTPVRLR